MEDNKCKICGDVVYFKDFCYEHDKLMKRLKIYDKDIETIKQILEEKAHLLKKYKDRLKNGESCCKICGQPCHGDLCIIHKRINNYLSKDKKPSSK